MRLLQLLFKLGCVGRRCFAAYLSGVHGLFQSCFLRCSTFRRELSTALLSEFVSVFRRFGMIEILE